MGRFKLAQFRSKMNPNHQIKKYLLSKQKEVANKLRDLDEEEISYGDVTPESYELGTSSWQADTESTKRAVRERLLDFSQKIQLTLLKLQKGTYGKCDKCKKQIEEARLEIMPIATLCIVCVN
ncbi:MAG: TraR/DksA C4-type zinc finger protein [Patescibacteria group bacterium]